MKNDLATLHRYIVLMQPLVYIKCSVHYLKTDLAPLPLYNVLMQPLVCRNCSVYYLKNVLAPLHLYILLMQPQVYSYIIFILTTPSPQYLAALVYNINWYYLELHSRSTAVQIILYLWNYMAQIQQCTLCFSWFSLYNVPLKAVHLS